MAVFSVGQIKWADNITLTTDQTISGTKTFQAGSASKPSLIAKATAGQSHIQEWQDPNGAVVAYVGIDGTIGSVKGIGADENLVLAGAY